MTRPAETRAKWSDLLYGLALLAVVGILDYFTGYELSFFLFYLVPIIFVLRRCGMAQALGMSVLAAFVWFYSNAIAGETYTDWIIPIWNTALRLMVFLLAVSLLAVRRELKKQVRQRTEKLSREITERHRLEQDLLETSEREQRRIGRDLHDSLGQHLTATALAGKVLANKLAGKSIPEATAANHLVKLVEEAIELTRTLARSLYPMEMKAEGLTDGLQELAANVSKRFKVSCRFDCPQTVSLADPAANVHLYRITQEAISNAIKHGQAGHITIRLETAEPSVVLTITDDGAGLPKNFRNGDGMGLRIMKYRADMIGATFDIRRLPERGTCVTCTLPKPVTT